MLNRALNLVHLDFAPRHQQPSGARVVLATIVSIVGSLAVDALIVVIFQAAFPSTKGYAHFQFSDYSKLTIIGVIIACIAWPIVTRITSEPRWMFVRMAVLVTLVLWLPDVYHPGQRPARQGGGRPVPHAPGDRAGHLQRACAAGAGPRAATRFSRQCAAGQAVT